MIEERVHFLVGMPKCGITALSRCLNSHPDIAVFGQSRFFGRYFVEPRRSEGYGRDELVEILRVLTEFEWPTTLGGGPGCLRRLTLDGMRALVRDVHTDMRPPVPPGLLFRTLAERVGDAEGKRLVIEKTPHHMNWVDRIAASFPYSRFVVFLCDPYAFARFHRAVIPDHHPIACALLWRGYIRSYERALHAYGDRLVTVHAAELARRPADALARVQRFLEVPVYDIAAPLAAGVGGFPESYLADAQPVDVFWLNLLAARDMRKHGHARRATQCAPWAVLVSLASLPLWLVRTVARMRRPRFRTFPYLFRWVRA